MERIGKDTLHFRANMLRNVGYSPLALPLGELSPQVTERVLQPFLNNKINLCAHTTKISVDIPGWRITKPPNQEPSRIENVPHHKQAPEVHNAESHPIQ